MQSQWLFREVNDRILQLNERFGLAGVDRPEWVCECVDAGCTAKLEMTVPEYRALRERADCFAVAPGHENDERVVMSCPRYSIVEPQDGDEDIATMLAAL